MDCSKRWDEAGNYMNVLLLQIIPRLESVSFQNDGDDFETTVEKLFAAEDRLREKTDGLLLNVFSGGDALDRACPESLYMVSLRIQAAMDFLGQLFLPYSKNDPFSDPLPEEWADMEMMRWLLVDLWHRRADHWMKLVAMALRTPFAFYGLEDADPDLGD